jgi:GTP:adenosylcobinamide-phosphate guanylyltransferase
MVVRVVRALRGCAAVGRIAVCIERPEVLAGVLDGVEVVGSGGTASASVLAILEAHPDWLPLLVATADHALLTSAMVEGFVAGIPDGADVAAATVPAEAVRRAFPEATRTFLRFRDGALKGANLFAFATPGSARAAALWSRVEAFRKRPLRLIAELGVVPALAFALGRLTLAGAVARLERRLDLGIATVALPIAEAAIDVDKPEDLALAERVLAAGSRS